ncbi:universal stress protein [Microvirga puerhi]|uniref:Universal stress protein n=1 Tax=Microvirga puerhi TaxID=2876078 RepID=A0ABS7VUL0_9HYPH|nr:universal stress protein [Microvirga puerhi]MBZ6078805.1 universal stress protein [Microvirga puerhi]
MFRHILIPTDGSPLSGEAIAYGVKLASGTSIRITFLTVTEPFHTFSFEAAQLQETEASYRDALNREAARRLEEAEKAATSAQVSCGALHAEDDQPYEAIIRTAKEKGCDLILMASHGRRGISALVLGSETVKVLTHSSIPVLVYRTPGKATDQVLAQQYETEKRQLSEQLP